MSEKYTIIFMKNSYKVNNINKNNTFTIALYK